MTDEFNLVPTSNLEKHLDNILRAASGEEPQYDLAPNWRIEQYLAAIAAKLSGSALPPITAADNGKVLTANSGVWGAQNPIGKPFIVTLTPTAADFSGTMDKTVAEINAAYEAGQEIWFNVVAQGMGHIELKCTQVGFEEGFEFPSFNTTFVNDANNVLILLATFTTNDGTKQTYSTHVYALTPAT